MPGLARARVAPGSQRPGVQGIASNLDDLRLRGKNLKVVVGDALLDGTLVRTIGGASTLKLEIEDRKRRLLNSRLLQERYDLSLDGLPFRFVKAAAEGRGEPLALTHEARAIALLRELHGPNKAFRNKVTRAEFAKRLVDEAKPRIRFVCPQLHTVQPIANARDSRQAKEEAEQTRGKGIGDEELTVKGIPATAAQKEAGDRALRQAASEGAAPRVMVALMVSLIVESLIGDVSPNWLQIEPQSVSGFPGNPNSLEESVRGFLQGYDPSSEGALEYFRKHPDAKAYEIAQAVQRSGAGLPSNGAANYGPWVQEAAEWLEGYGGGSISTVEFTRYAFEESRKEDHWGCISRLAKEVRWRCFESAGWVYYIDDRDLLDSIMRMVVSDSTPGILDTAYDYDVGKEVTELRVIARARAWAAPPGSVAVVRKHGPASGRYIVHRIESPLRRRNSKCEILLRRPTEPLPEPAPESRVVTTSFGTPGGGSFGAMGTLEGTPEDIVNQIVSYANANGFPNVTRSSVRAANAAHGPTSSGGTSDHQGPPTVRWAADISNGSSPTPEMDALAQAIWTAYDLPPLDLTSTGGSTQTSEAVHGGYRFQLIYRSTTGGNHYNHVHIGVAVA